MSGGHNDSKNGDDGEIDVIVRFHNPTRLPELKRCIFSLVGQNYRPIHIILATQRFSPADQASVENALKPFLEGEDGISFTMVNWEKPEPADARSVLLNIGVAAARGRYLAYLDYDDALFPDAYALMIDQLQKSGAAIAFASVRVMQVHVYPSFFRAEEKLPSFRGKALIDLFRSNFCPLHSYVLDRRQIDPSLLSFQNALVMEEDYDVLLRICAIYKSDFGLIGTEIGDYYYKNDGSNTVPVNGVFTAESEERYKGVRAAIEHRKRTTVVTDDIQRELGIPPKRLMSIRDVVERYA